MGKNPHCIAGDTLPGFSHLENRISTQPPLSRYGKVLPTFLRLVLRLTANSAGGVYPKEAFLRGLYLLHLSPPLHLQ